MIRANDIRDMVNSIDPNVDQFISECVQPAMVNNVVLSTMINESTVSQFFLNIGNGKPVGSSKFIKQMEMRGFVVHYKCDDRPRGSCWYEISIPAQ